MAQAASAGRGLVHLRSVAWVMVAVMATLLTVAGCGGTPRGGGVVVPGPPTARAPLPSAVNCPAPPARGWVADMTLGGRVAWQIPLGTPGIFPSATPPPVAAGGMAVFAQQQGIAQGTVNGVRLADGHAVWSWPVSQEVSGMWGWGGLVIVLSYEPESVFNTQPASQARLTALDTSTGAVRWSHPLPGDMSSPGITYGDGLAAAQAGGTWQVIDLADGRVAWTLRSIGSSVAGMADGLVLASRTGAAIGSSGQLTGYDARSGRRRWTVSGLPGQMTVVPADGLALITGSVAGAGEPTALTAVDLASGRVSWRFDAGIPVTGIPAGTPGASAGTPGSSSGASAGPVGLAVISTQSPGGLYLLDPQTGHLRWHVTTEVVQSTAPLVTGTEVVTVEEGTAGGQTARITGRAAANGRQLWAHVLPALPVGGMAQLGGDGVLQVNAAHSGQPAPLLAYQLATGRLDWQANLPSEGMAVPVGGGLLIQSLGPVACADSSG